MQTRIVQFSSLGGPEVLELVDVAMPTPGPGEVRIAVKALGLNRAEAMFRQGAYLEQPSLPSKIGYEAAGTIDAIGDDVGGFEIGQKVSVIPAFTLAEHGVYGQHAIVPARAVVAHPDHLSFEQAAALWMQYLTAYGALVDVAGLARGDTVVITAGSSSVGIAAIQLARAIGATVIATTRGEKKKQALLNAGADHVVVTDHESLGERVMAITKGAGAQVIFDPVVGDTLQASADAASQFGKIVVYGGLNPGVPVFPLITALAKGLSVRGYTLFELSNDDARLASAVDAILGLLSDGKLEIVISKVFRLSEIVEAHGYLEANDQFGKIVVSV